MAAGIQLELTGTILGGGARIKGDGFFSTVGFTRQTEEGGGAGWKCKKKPKPTLKKPS